MHFQHTLYSLCKSQENRGENLLWGQDNRPPGRHLLLAETQSLGDLAKVLLLHGHLGETCQWHNHTAAILALQMGQAVAKAAFIPNMIQVGADILLTFFTAQGEGIVLCLAQNRVHRFLDNPNKEEERKNSLQKANTKGQDHWIPGFHQEKRSNHQRRKWQEGTNDPKDVRKRVEPAHSLDKGHHCLISLELDDWQQDKATQQDCREVTPSSNTVATEVEILQCANPIAYSILSEVFVQQLSHDAVEQTVGLCFFQIITGMFHYQGHHETQKQGWNNRKIDMLIENWLLHSLSIKGTTWLLWNGQPTACETIPQRPPEADLLDMVHLDQSFWQISASASWKQCCKLQSRTGLAWTPLTLSGWNLLS